MELSNFLIWYVEWSNSKFSRNAEISPSSFYDCSNFFQIYEIVSRRREFQKLQALIEPIVIFAYKRGDPANKSQMKSNVDLTMFLKVVFSFVVMVVGIAVNVSRYNFEQNEI